MNRQEKILKNLATILAAPLIKDMDDEIELVTPHEHTAERLEGGALQRQLGLAALGEHRAQIYALLSRALGPVPANPSMPGNRTVHERIYCFPDEFKDADATDASADQIDYAFPRLPGWQLDPGLTPPNKNAHEAEQFAVKLSDLAQKMRRVYESKVLREPLEPDPSGTHAQLSKQSKILLVGDKGIGKTAFLNYIFTVFNSSVFDANDVIWVRVDYTLKAPKEVTLLDRIRWQACRILLTYYDSARNPTKDGLVLDLSPSNPKLLDRLLMSGISNDRDLLATEFANVTARILTDASPTKMEPGIFKAIFDYLSLDVGVGFVIAIAGLDQLGLTHQQIADFQTKLCDVEQYVYPREALSAAYLVTMRYESARESAGHIPHRGSHPIYTLLGVPSEKIYLRRLDWLQDRSLVSHLEFSSLHKMRMPDFKNDIAEIWRSFIDFVGASLRFNLEGQSGGDMNDAFRLLDQIFGHDKRQVFHALGHIMRYFLLNRIDLDELVQQSIEMSATKSLKVRPPLGVNVNLVSGRSGRPRRYYLVVEALMLLGNLYQTNRYTYELDVTAEETHVSLTFDRGDDVFLNIFKHPYVSPSCLSVFAGTRILQYLTYSDGLAQRAAVIDFLGEFFAYPEYVLETLIDEMMDGGLLEVRHSAINRIRGQIRLTSKGRFILERLSKTLEYMNLAMQTVPLPLELVAEGKFPIAEYGTRKFVLDNKIVGGVNFARLLADAERFERRYFNRVAGAKYSEASGRSFDDWYGNSFSVSRQTIDEVLASARRMVESASPPLVAGIEERLLTEPERWFGSVEGLERD